MNRGVMEPHQIAGFYSKGSVTCATIVAEFHFEDPGGECFDDGSHLAAHQPLLRQVPKQSNRSQEFQFNHRIYCSYRIVITRPGGKQ
jgi:hypothetical protein